jgi:hypothetical protein
VPLLCGDLAGTRNFLAITGTPEEVAQWLEHLAGLVRELELSPDR